MILTISAVCGALYCPSKSTENGVYTNSIRFSVWTSGIPYGLLFFQFGHRMILSFENSILAVSKAVQTFIYFQCLILFCYNNNSYCVGRLIF